MAVGYNNDPGPWKEALAGMERRLEDARENARRNRPRERKLWHTGGSVVMALPKDFLDVLGWKAGDAVLVSLDGKSVIIE